MALVEAPTALHRQPRQVHRIEREILGDDGTGLQRRVRRVEPETGLGHRDAGGGRLGGALLGEGDVVPAGEQVGEVPLRLAVAEDHECSGHGLIVGGSSELRPKRHIWGQTRMERFIAGG